jgi:hypothetical protein
LSTSVLSDMLLVVWYSCGLVVFVNTFIFCPDAVNLHKYTEK